MVCTGVPLHFGEGSTTSSTGRVMPSPDGSPEALGVEGGPRQHPARRHGAALLLRRGVQPGARRRDSDVEAALRVGRRAVPGTGRRVTSDTIHLPLAWRI